MLELGRKIEGYEILNLVGEGGMAQVWLARRDGKHGFSKLFAVKVIQRRLASDPQFRAMFLDEARIASEIAHPNVAQVLDLGDHDGMLYLVMEYVDGESLAALLGTAGRRAGDAARVPTATALRIIADVCAGLDAAHRLEDERGALRNVVHRDVSPQNILLGVRGEVKLIDFGVAKAAGRLGGETEVATLKGKLRYMPFEQATQGALGPYTDVYAAGAVLYRMLAGRAPHEGANEAATLNLLLSRAAAPPLPDDVPPRVAAIVERALSPQPTERYQTASTMQSAIEAALADLGDVPDVASWVKDNLSSRYRERVELANGRARVVGAQRADEPSGGTMASPYGLPRAAAAATEREAAPEGVPDLALPDAPRTGPYVARAAEPERNELELSLEPRLSPPELDAVRARSSDANEAPALDRALGQPEDPGIPTSPLPMGSRAPAPSPTESEEPRSLMDVGAIAKARRAAAAEPHRPEPAGAATRTPDRGPGSGTTTSPPATPSGAKTSPPAKIANNPGWTGSTVAGGSLVLLIVASVLVAPFIVKNKVVAAARAWGIQLDVERVSLGLSGVVLRDVTARAPSVPGVEVRAAEILANGTSGDAITVRGIDAQLTGRFDVLGPALAHLYEQNRARLAPSGEKPRRVSLVSARVTWTDLLGAGSKLDANGAGAEIDCKPGVPEESRGMVERLEITTPKTVLGPWAASFERAPSRSRVRIAFDPPVPDGPSAAVAWGPGAAPHLTVKIPRTPLAHLGLRPADLGVPADASSELEMRLEAGTAPTGRVEGDASLDLWAARMQGWKQPVDLHVEARASGAPNKPLDLERTTVRVGPFAAAVTGTLTPHDGGFRLDATWRTQPIACEKLARAEAKSFGAFAETLHDIAQSTGAVKVTGSAHAAGLVKYDTRAPEDAAISVQTRETCGLRLFGL